jgi:uncharacterized protein
MFIGRKEELEVLKRSFGTRVATFIAIRGRRRIGKSRLIEEFSKNFPKILSFTGIPPTHGVTKKSQREEFVNQMRRHKLPLVDTSDWSPLFWAVAKEAEKGPVLIVLDEIAWMGSKDPAFLGKLKIAWDLYFGKNPKLVLVVASSISSWIDENILKSTGFFGRVDITLTLKELPLKDCIKFFGKRAKTISAYEKLKLLSITGGVPKYLEAINPAITAEENILQLCFSKEGLLFNDFDRIFHDLFLRRSDTYKGIVVSLVENHSLTQSEICKKLNRGNGRVISKYMKDLVEAGFLSADFTWDIKTGKVGKLRKYRLSDNYLRFYLRYIAPNKENIQKKKVKKTAINSLIQWESILGLQFENLVIHNSDEIFKQLNIRLEDYTYDGPFFQTRSRDRKGCQIDYVIQEKNTLYVCEIKFSKNPIGPKVIEEVERKIKALTIPRNISYRPVLIHVGGVTDEVVYRDYFDKIIDWTELLK